MKRALKLDVTIIIKGKKMSSRMYSAYQHSLITSLRMRVVEVIRELGRVDCVNRFQMSTKIMYKD